jgi:hypothetical protein
MEGSLGPARGTGEDPISTVPGGLTTPARGRMFHVEYFARNTTRRTSEEQM